MSKVSKVNIFYVEIRLSVDCRNDNPIKEFMELLRNKKIYPSNIQEGIYHPYIFSGSFATEHRPAIASWLQNRVSKNERLSYHEMLDVERDVLKIIHTPY